MSFEAAVHAQAIDLDRLAAEACATAGSGHTTSALSLGHIVTVLMFRSMRWSPELPDYPTSDRLVLSAGHAVPVVYAAASRLGMMVGRPGEDRRRLTPDDLSSLRDIESVLDGHPNPMEGFPLFDAATCPSRASRKRRGSIRRIGVCIASWATARPVKGKSPRRSISSSITA